MLYELARARGDEAALDDLTVTRSWAELADRTTRMARLLSGELGLEPGDRVATLMFNRGECLELVLASWLAGLWLTPINHHLLADEIDYVLTDSGARVVICDEQHHDDASAGCLDAATLLVAGDELDGAISSAPAQPYPPDSPMGGTMIYTSGTTGRPRGVKRHRPSTLAAGLEAAAAYGRRIQMDGRGRHLINGPAYHAAPLLFAVYDLLNGAAVTMMPRWDEQRFFDLVGEQQVTHTHLVPTMFERLLGLPDEQRAAFDPTPLVTVLHGAAPVSPDSKQRMITWWGPLLLEYWGATESGVVTLVDSADWQHKQGTVGRAVEGWQIFAGNEQGTPLPANEEGILYCRRPDTRQWFEYHGDPDKTRAAFVDAHTFHLGDIGLVDENGYAFLRDRLSNTIISGGVNIYPAEIEKVLITHPQVTDVAVFAVPDPEWGEAVMAAVQTLPGTNGSPELAAEVIDFARERLAAYKLPRRIEFHAELPRTDSGKLYVRRLKERHWKDSGRRI